MPKSILVVDDSVFMRRLLRDVLTHAGYLVFEAVSGEDAVEKYGEVHPDLVTMDLGMPGMSGLEALRLIRERDALARIVVISARGTDDYIERALSAGASGYLRKPFQPASLLDRVRRSLLVPPTSRC